MSNRHKAAGVPAPEPSLGTPVSQPHEAGLSPGLVIVLSLPALFWAGNFIVGRAVSGLVGPVTLSVGRWLLALLVLLPFAIKPLRHDWQHHRALYWQHRWRIFGVAVLGVAVFNTLVYLGLRTTTATNGILLQSMIPILIVLLGALLYGQKLRAVQVLGLAVSFLGVLTIITHGDWARVLRLQFGRGDLIIFMAVVSWAFYTLWLRAIPAQINRVSLLAVQIVLGIAVTLPFLAWEAGAGIATQWTPTSLAALVYIGIFPSVLAFLCYNYGVAHAGAARTGQFIHLMPLFGALLSVLVLGERLHFYHCIGMAAILLGIVLSSRRQP